MVDIYGFIEPINYLKSVLTERKSVDSLYSVSQFSKDLSFNSAQVLSDIFKGKRALKNKYSEQIVKGLKLDASEELYFHTMTFFVNAKDSRQRSAFKQLLLTLNPGERDEVRLQDTELFSSWLNIATLTLSRTKDFELSEEYIKSAFRKSVSKEEVQMALKILTEKKYLKQNKKLAKSISSETDKKIISAKSYYCDVSELAKDAALLDPELREFQCFSMAIKKENIDQAKQLIRDFRKKFANLCESDEADEVYQTNIQFFPLTDLTDTKSLN